MDRVRSRGAQRPVWPRWFVALAFSSLMVAPSARAAGSHENGGMRGDTVPFVVSSALPIRECQLVIKTDAEALTTAAGTTADNVSPGRAPFALLGSSAIIVLGALLVALVIANAAKKMRKMRVENDLAKLALREVGPTGKGALALLRAQSHLILCVQTAEKNLPKEAIDPAKELAKACATFLDRVGK